MNISDAIAFFKDGEQNGFSDIWDRNDGDFKMITQQKYQLENHNKEPVPEAYSITTPWVNNYYTYALALFGTTKMVVEVDSDEKNGGLAKDKRAIVERNIQSLLENMEHSTRQNYPQLNGYFPQTYNDICGRGYVITRPIAEEDDGELFLDTPTVDSRYSVFEYGKRGKVSKFCTRTDKRLGDIIADYGNLLDDDGNLLTTPEGIEKVFKGSVLKRAYGVITGRGKTQTVTEFWSEDEIIVGIGSEEIISTSNPKGYVPFVVEKSGLGVYLTDVNGSLKYQAESLCGPLRDTWEADNRHQSVMSTMSSENFRAALFISDDTLFANSIDKQGGLAAKAGSEGTGGWPVMFGPSDTKIEKLYPQENLSQASIEHKNYLEQSKREGTFGAYAPGNQPLTTDISGTALRTIIAQKEKILVPITRALEAHYANVLRMLIKQIVDGDLKGKLGETGLQKEYSKESFDGLYSLKVKILMELPEKQQLALSIVQQMLELGVSLVDALTYAGFQDPEGVAARGTFEKMKEIVPEFGKQANMAEMMKHGLLTDSMIKTLAAEWEVSMEEVKARLDQVNQFRAQMGMPTQGGQAPPSPGGEGEFPSQPGTGISHNLAVQAAMKPSPEVV